MSLEFNALQLANVVGMDIRALLRSVGSVDELTTIAKDNIVNAINEINSGINAVDITQVINDASGSGSKATVWSVTKIIDSLNVLKGEILDGVGSSYDTLKEIADYLDANDNGINDILTTLANTIRFDQFQDLTVDQQNQASSNIGIGAASVKVDEEYLVSSDTNTYIEPGYVLPGYVE